MLNQIALVHSAGCFLNSFLREWTEVVYEKMPERLGSRSGVEMFASIQLEPGRILHIPMKKFSKVGRHQYGSTFYLQDLNHLRELEFIEMADLLTRFICSKYDVAKSQLEAFSHRLKGSIENISESLEFRKEDIQGLYGLPFDFIRSEQSLLVGHLFHPTPKSREEFSGDDFRKYSPEMAGSFKMRWVWVKEEVLYHKNSNQFQSREWASELFLSEFDDIEKAKSVLLEMSSQGLIPMPMHPWQKERLFAIPRLSEWKRLGKIRDGGESDYSWSPTSSLRSVYRRGAPFMLKFSLSLRLTNSIRHLLPKEVIRSIQVHDVLSTSKGKEFLSRYPNFKPIFEPAFVSFKDEDGEPMKEAIVVCRENLFQGDLSAGKVVLATLTQDHPLGGENLIQKMIRQRSEKYQQSLEESSLVWFSKFLETTLTPLLMGQAEYGILLGAHQQNLVLEIKDDLPATTYFRDCQGTGYTQTGYSLFAKDVSELKIENGNILDNKIGSFLFCYYVIINSTFSVIAAIAKDNWIKEEKLISHLRQYLLKLRGSHPPDVSCLDYLLESKTLMQKGNFLCTFKSINENTSSNPFEIYNSIPNPVAQGEHLWSF